jgi:hypothetical protein
VVITDSLTPGIWKFTSKLLNLLEFSAEKRRTREREISDI